MADENGQPRTEAATPRRREEARKKGQIVFSSDLTSGLLLLAGTGLLWLLGSDLSEKLLWIVRVDLLHIHRAELDTSLTSSLLTTVLEDGLKLAGILVGLLFLVGLGIGGAQSGFNVTLEPLGPDWGRLSPVNGWSRMFSWRSAMRSVTALLKLTAIVFIVWWIVVKHQSQRISHAGHGSLNSAARYAWDMTIRGAVTVSAALVLIGLLDYLFQRWRHEEDLKMSRQDLKDELRQEEGDPLIRSRLKKVQRELAQRRSIRDVPGATVVLTNPTHFAVAIKYDRYKMSAPKVVAKGADLFARRIIKVANENGVPVVERKALARMLYSAVEVGSEIPTELYLAIAEILAYVYRLKRAS
ncbi:MAG: flagellar biosynthesis protein FlhB [Planctomycetaceae bacterium]